MFTDSSPQTQYVHLYTYLHTDTVCLEKPLQINIQESSKVLVFTEMSPLNVLGKTQLCRSNRACSFLTLLVRTDLGQPYPLTATSCHGRTPTFPSLLFPRPSPPSLLLPDASLLSPLAIHLPRSTALAQARARSQAGRPGPRRAATADPLAEQACWGRLPEAQAPAVPPAEAGDAWLAAGKGGLLSSAPASDTNPPPAGAPKPASPFPAFPWASHSPRPRRRRALPLTGAVRARRRAPSRGRGEAGARGRGRPVRAAAGGQSTAGAAASERGAGAAGAASPACEHAAPGGGLPRPGRGRFSQKLGPGREEEERCRKRRSGGGAGSPRCPRGQHVAG